MYHVGDWVRVKEHIEDDHDPDTGCYFNRIDKHNMETYCGGVYQIANHWTSGGGNYYHLKNPRGVLWSWVDNWLEPAVFEECPCPADISDIFDII